MHTYKKEEGQGRFSVGYYQLFDVVVEFVRLKTFKNESQAATFTSFLNGAAHDILLIQRIMEDALC